MNTVQKFLVVIILIIGLILRLHNYDIYPQRGATSDEYSYSFLGVSLLTKHVPISWSAFPQYPKKTDLIIRKIYFPIVSPYFDHPPLNGLVVGAWALLFGENTFSKIELKTIRLIPIFLSMLSSIFVFLLAFRLYNYKTAIWALIIYSTTVIFVMNGRVVLAENLLTPLFLGAVFLFCRNRKKMTIKKTIAIGILCGLAFLSKELGIAAFLSMLYLFLTERIKPKLVVTLVFSSLFFVFLYALYGMYYNWDLFFKVVFEQSSRNIGPQTLLYITSTPIIVNKIYYDGWYFFGFLTFFFSFLEYKKNKMLLIPMLTYFLLIIFSLTQKGEMGWYLIPLFPFMAIFSALFVKEGIENKDWRILLFLLFVGLYEIQYLFAENFGLTPFQFRFMLILMFGPLLLSYILKKDKLAARLSSAWFYLLILGNIILAYNYIHPA